MEIKILGLNKRYSSGKIALQNVELCFRAPGMVGLLGPNGAGKTTLMKLLTAAILPTFTGQRAAYPLRITVKAQFGLSSPKFRTV